MTTKDIKEIKDGIKIKVDFIIGSTNTAIYLDCEGDQAWFPKSLIDFNEKEMTVIIPKWKLKQLGWVY